MAEPTEPPAVEPPAEPPIGRCVYLLHFTQPYKHARHMLSCTQYELAGALRQLRERAQGAGTGLLAALLAAGGDFVVADVWTADSTVELYRVYAELRASHPSPGRLCSICHPDNERGGRKGAG